MSSFAPFVSASPPPFDEDSPRDNFNDADDDFGGFESATPTNSTAFKPIEPANSAAQMGINGNTNIPSGLLNNTTNNLQQKNISREDNGNIYNIEQFDSRHNGNERNGILDIKPNSDNSVQNVNQNPDICDNDDDDDFGDFSNFSDHTQSQESSGYFVQSHDDINIRHNISNLADSFNALHDSSSNKVDVDSGGKVEDIDFNVDTGHLDNLTVKEDAGSKNKSGTNGYCSTMGGLEDENSEDDFGDFSAADDKIATGMDERNADSVQKPGLVTDTPATNELEVNTLSVCGSVEMEGDREGTISFPAEQNNSFIDRKSASIENTSSNNAEQNSDCSDVNKEISKNDLDMKDCNKGLDSQVDNVPRDNVDDFLEFKSNLSNSVHEAAEFESSECREQTIQSEEDFDDFQACGHSGVVDKECAGRFDAEERLVDSPVNESGVKDSVIVSQSSLDASTINTDVKIENPQSLSFQDGVDSCEVDKVSRSEIEGGSEKNQISKASVDDTSGIINDPDSDDFGTFETHYSKAAELESVDIKEESKSLESRVDCDSEELSNEIKISAAIDKSSKNNDESESQDVSEDEFDDFCSSNKDDLPYEQQYSEGSVLKISSLSAVSDEVQLQSPQSGKTDEGFGEFLTSNDPPASEDNDDFGDFSTSSETKAADDEEDEFESFQESEPKLPSGSAIDTAADLTQEGSSGVEVSNLEQQSEIKFNDDDDFDDFADFQTNTTAFKLSGANRSTGAEGLSGAQRSEGAQGSESAADNGGWSAFGSESKEESDDWSAFSDALSDSTEPTSTVTTSKPISVQQHVQPGKQSLSGTDFSSSINRVLQASFKDSDESTDTSDVISLVDTIGFKNLQQIEDKSSAPPDRGILAPKTQSKSAPVDMNVWNSIKIMEETPALKFAWNGSTFNKNLLKAMNIDSRNILVGNKKSMPIYAASLGLLEPNKSPLMPTVVEKPLTVESPTGISGNTVFTQEMPQVQFDWTSSGLTNPLDASQKEKELLESLEIDSPDVTGSTVYSTVSIQNLLANSQSSTTMGVKSEGRKISRQALKVLDSIPDLSFMSAKVLMFPLKEDPTVES